MTADRKLPRIRAALCWSVVFLISLLSAIGIAVLARRMAPVREGDSHVFWKFATGVSLSPNIDDGWGGHANFVDDTWAAYESYNAHGSDIYRVSRPEVLADFATVVALLEQAVQRGEDTPVVRGYVNWRDDDEKTRSGLALLDAIKRERNRELIEVDVELLTYRVASEQQFWQRCRAIAP